MPHLPVASPTVNLVGKVIDAVTGEGVSGAQIVVQDYPLKADLSASDGSFFIAKVPVGRQVLLVTSAGYASQSEVVNIPPQGTFEITIELSPFLGKLVGFVWDEEENPVSGATVTVDGKYTTITQASGEFSLANLPVGTSILTVEKTGFVPHSEDVDIEASSITVVKVVLQKPAP